MALLIDTPRWFWRGQLWAHMISDTDLEELHTAARSLDLRWVAFGRDHYDIPESRWPAACEVAELVDSREIVRSLRRTGLREHGGKPKKTWRRLDQLPEHVVESAVGDWLAEVRPHFEDAAIEVLTRPGELVVMHLRRTPDAPDIGALSSGPAHPDSRLVHTVADRRYSLELVLSSPREPAR